MRYIEYIIPNIVRNAIKIHTANKTIIEVFCAPLKYFINIIDAIDSKTYATGAIIRVICTIEEINPIVAAVYIFLSADLEISLILFQKTINVI